MLENVELSIEVLFWILCSFWISAFFIFLLIYLFQHDANLLVNKHIAQLFQLFSVEGTLSALFSLPLAEAERLSFSCF